MISIDNDFISYLFIYHFAESYNLPAKPSLELAVGQTKACLRQMGKAGLGVCAFANVDDFICR